MEKLGNTKGKGTLCATRLVYITTLGSLIELFDQIIHYIYFILSIYVYVYK